MSYLRRILLIVSFAGLASQQTRAETVDPSLIEALHQATRDIQEQTTDLNALVWLSSMSEKLDARILNPFYRIRLLEAVHREAERAGLDPQLVLAVIDVESGFDRHAVSRVGAQGLMQVMPFWKEIHGTPQDDLFNPLVSLRYGCTILRHYIDKYKSLEKGLAAYNGSLGRKKYPNKVLGRMNGRWRYKLDTYDNDFQPKMATR